MKRKVKVLLTMMCVCILATAPTVMAGQQNETEIPVYYEMPDFTNDDLPDEFLVIEDCEGTNQMTRAYVESLIVSFDENRYNDGTIYIYNQKYKTYTFNGGYSKTTKYTLTGTFALGKTYHATVSYTFN